MSRMRTATRSAYSSTTTRILPVRQSFSWLDPVTKQRNDEVTEFDKWRDAGGVQWPFTIERHRNGYKTYQIFANKVEIDQPLPPNIFDAAARSQDVEEGELARWAMRSNWYNLNQARAGICVPALT